MSKIRERARQMSAQRRELMRVLVALRRERGLTQAQVDEIIWAPAGTVHQLEQYDSDPPLSLLHRYANALGASITHAVVIDVSGAQE